MTTDTRTATNTTGIRRFIPILSWLPRYDRSWLTVDIIAGLTLWGLVVPEGMAYAGIAGLPPQAGLYTLLAALLVYALLGTSRHLVVQATSATAALLASAVAAALVATAAANASDPETYQAYASAFVLVTGLVFLAAGLARLGFITQFLSKPVMDGFVVGLALFVVVGQLNKLFGVPKPEGNTVEKLLGIIKELPQANWVTFAVGAAALALLFLLPRWNKKLPAGLVVLFGAIALSAALDLHGKYGVEIVGTLPQGLPTLAFPRVPFTTYLAMILPAMGVLLVAYSEALGVAHEFAEKHGYEVNADQELNAHAVANLVSALFGGMLAGGSMSASAVKEGAGARSQVTNLVTWVVTIITVLFLTPLFTTLPEAVLAALIIHALWHILAVAQTAEDPPGVAGGVLVRRAGAGRRAVDRCVGRHDHRGGRIADLRDLPLEPAAYRLVGARPRRARRLLGPGPASRGYTHTGGVDRARRWAVVLRQRTHRPGPGESHDR